MFAKWAVSFPFWQRRDDKSYCNEHLFPLNSSSSSLLSPSSYSLSCKGFISVWFLVARGGEMHFHFSGREAGWRCVQHHWQYRLSGHCQKVWSSWWRGWLLQPGWKLNPSRDVGQEGSRGLTLACHSPSWRALRVAVMGTSPFFHSPLCSLIPGTAQLLKLAYTSVVMKECRLPPYPVTLFVWVRCFKGRCFGIHSVAHSVYLFFMILRVSAWLRKVPLELQHRLTQCHFLVYPQINFDFCQSYNSGGLNKIWQCNRALRDTLCFNSTLNSLFH